MAVTEQFRAVITVDDQTANPIRRIGLSLSRLAGNRNMARLGQTAARIGAQFRNMGQTIASIARPLAIAGGVAGGAAIAAGAGLLAMVNSTVEAGDALNDMSNQLGISVEAIQELGYAAAQHGLAPEMLTGSLEKLTRVMFNASRGTNKRAADLFRSMNIPLTENGRLRTSAEILPELAEAFRNTTNPALRTAAAMELFGRGGAGLIRLLSVGGVGLEELRARFRELDGSITSDTVPRLDAAGDAMLEVRTAITGIRNAIVVQLTPTLGPMLVQLASWIASNKEIIATRVHEVVLRLSDALKSINWTAVIAGVDSFSANVQVAYDWVGEWRGILIGLGALLAAPFVAAGTSIIASLAGIAAILGGPITLAVVGAGAMALVLIKYWEPISDFFKGLWDGVVSGINNFGAAMSRAHDRMKPQLEALHGIFLGIKSVIEWLISNIPNIPGINPRTAETADTQRRALSNAPARAMGYYDESIDEMDRRLNPDAQDGPPGGRRQPLPFTGRQPSGQNGEAAEGGENGPARPRRGGLGARPQAPLVDPDTGRPLRAQPQSLWQSPSGGGQRGEVDVNVRFENVPAGTRVQADSSGVARRPDLSVGYARMGVG